MIDPRMRALETLMGGQPIGQGSLAPLAPVSLPQAMPEAEGVATTFARSGPSEYDALLEQARKAGLGVDFMRAGSMINEALTGAKAPMDLYAGLEARAQQPLQNLERRRKAALEDPFSPETIRRRAALERANPELAKSLGAGDDTSWGDIEAIQGIVPAAPRAGSAARPAKDNDPSSPVSKRYQDAFRAQYPDAPRELIGAITEENFDAFRKTLEAGAGVAARRDATAAGMTRAQADRTSRENLAAQQLGLGRDRLNAQLAMFGLRLEDDKEARAAKDQEKKDALVVPGAVVDPSARPTPKDAETVKGVLTSEKRLQSGIARMRQLHAKYGTEKGGKGGMWFKQAMTGLQIEAKNIADLGALSGPDQGLMESLAGDDPTTAWANVKAFFGQDNTEAALQGLEVWMEGQVRATLEARGYRRGAAPSPVQRTPAAQALPKDSSGQPTLDAPATTTKETRKYSPSTNTTYILDDAGKVIRTLPGRATSG